MGQEETSQVLVRRAQDGDREALDLLINRHRPRLCALLGARLGDVLRKRVEVEDLAQEVLARACAALPHFRWSGDESFFRWLSAIARNAIHEVARREKREMILPLEATVDGRGIPAIRSLRREERFDRLRSAIKALKPEHRDVILLARIQRLPLREVAARMGRTPDAVVQLLRRALRRLKKQFGDTESLGLPDRSILEELGPEPEGRNHA